MSMDAPYDPNPPAYTSPPLTGPLPMDPMPMGPSAVTYAPPVYTPPPPAWAPPPAVYFAPPSVKVERLADELIIPAGYELATARRRVASYFLSVVLVVVTLGIGYAVWGVIAWRKGRTPTQQMLRLRTERMGDRGPAGWGRMALREIVGRFVELLVPPVVAIISLVMMLTRTDRRTIHDLIAGTAVVHELRRTPPPPADTTDAPIGLTEAAPVPTSVAGAEVTEVTEVTTEARAADDIELVETPTVATTDPPA
jgi:uncharacterized RDD family membrane protein YckC